MTSGGTDESVCITSAPHLAHLCVTGSNFFQVARRALFATASATDEPLEEPGDGDAAPATPESNGGSLLPYVVAIGLGIAVIPIVGGSFFIVHSKLLNRPKGLRSAETISRRLRK